MGAEDDGQDGVAEGAVLGDEIVRMTRQMGAWRQRAREEHWGDRLLLGRLTDSGPRRATDLAADTLLDLSTVSRQIRSLVERGLVERRPDPEDRRGTLLLPTPAGAQAVRAFRAQRNERLGQVLAGWPAEERQAFVRLLGRFNDEFAERHLRAPRAAPGPGGGDAGAG
ncbi:MarR family winged helix-turn-helix transcriptional regulator [Actinacidiphila sp. ITFR-21]|uniref:MarR family winged helix-turn-helix transcriptional regulator n=1 Tax=Actinacidiphila sp. ITFR-21 TaxID=3075199 RepID=UPI00288C4208|nr:MarR family transcriptional regulator [Streptomyces sp. ITFR-21]WNI14104.1 MarR family transcriptional regulator [Streptomyces sp. ITFR-21]